MVSEQVSNITYLVLTFLLLHTQTTVKVQSCFSVMFNTYTV